MRLSLYILSIIFGTVAAVYAFQARELQSQADAFLEEGRFLEALSTYEILTGEQFAIPWRAQANLRRGGILLLFLDDYKEAEKALNEAIRLDPDGPIGARAYFRLGMQFHQQSRYAEAAEAFRKSLELEPGGVNAPTAEFLLQQSERLHRLGITAEPEPVQPRSSHSIFMWDTDLRVAVARDVEYAAFTADSILKVMEPGGNVIARSEKGEIRLGFHKNGITINGESTDNGIIGIMTEGDGSITYQQFVLPKRLKVEKSERGLVIVALIDVEEYLRGVVPREMPASWPEEALKAQAVCARTYALYQKKRRGDYSYDILATVSSQVYGGEGSFHPRSDAAIEATRGMVLLYDDDLALTLFHSCSGGYTEDMKYVWGSGLPYLKGAVDPYSPPMDWDFEISDKELRDKLHNGGISCTRFSSITLSDISTSGRYCTAELTCSGERIELRSDKLRHILGPGQMKSTRITSFKSASTIHFTGQGFGHGVGLSQWGARNFASQGATYDEILSFYYPGTTMGIIKEK